MLANTTTTAELLRRTEAAGVEGETKGAANKGAANKRSSKQKEQTKGTANRWDFKRPNPHTHTETSVRPWTTPTGLPAAGAGPVSRLERSLVWNFGGGDVECLNYTIVGVR